MTNPDSEMVRNRTLEQIIPAPAGTLLTVRESQHTDREGRNLRDTIYRTQYWPVVGYAVVLDEDEPSGEKTRRMVPLVQTPWLYDIDYADTLDDQYFNYAGNEPKPLFNYFAKEIVFKPTVVVNEAE